MGEGVEGTVKNLYTLKKIICTYIKPQNLGIKKRQTAKTDRLPFRYVV